MQVVELHSTEHNSAMFDDCSVGCVGFSLKVSGLLCRFKHRAVHPHQQQVEASEHNEVKKKLG